MATTTTTRSSFFQTRLAAPATPVVTRAVQPATPRPLGYSVAKPTARPPNAIVLSWDNVLFPTKWMAECVGLDRVSMKLVQEAKRACSNNPFVVQALTAIEQQAIDLLAAATAKAPVFIVTDHIAVNLDAICTAYFPRLKACLANANGHVHIVSEPPRSALLTPRGRMESKLVKLQEICRSSMQHHHGVSAAVAGPAPFKLLAVSADEGELLAAARLQEQVARFGMVQSMSLPTAAPNGKALSLVDFHKQLQAVAAALESQY